MDFLEPVKDNHNNEGPYILVGDTRVMNGLLRK